MAQLGGIFFLVGLFGCGAMTLFFPLLALIFFRREEFPEKKNSKALVKSPERGTELDILIPAHNEAKTLAATLASIRRAESLGACKIKLHVGCDACTDATPEVAKKNGADSIRSYGHRSKWLTLLALVQETQSQWIALVDSGALWPENLLKNLAPYFHVESALAIAPAYFPAEASIAKKIHWALEQFFKRLEGFSTGPTSVHGATVFYRRENLVNALRSLEGRQWLNDDIAIPLALFLLTDPRHRFQDKRILYYVGEERRDQISDIGILQPANEWVRRSRMSRGNLEWMRLLLPPLKNSFAPAYWIAQRRVYRVFWAYWFFALGSGFSLLAWSRSWCGLAALAAACCLAIFILFKEAALGSFMAPAAIFFPEDEAGKKWK